METGFKLLAECGRSDHERSGRREGSTREAVALANQRKKRKRKVPVTPAVDEIEDYWNARYLSAVEATWRILGYNITRKDPSVTSLPVSTHPADTHRQYPRSNPAQTKSLMEHYFLRPTGMYTTFDGFVRSFESIPYSEYFALFRLATYDPTKVGRPNYYRELALQGHLPMHVILRTHAARHVTRLQPARPSEGERFYLRVLLQNRAARSLADCRTIDGQLFPSYQDAAVHLGLFEDDNEAQYAMQEAVDSLRTPRQLRLLFVHLIVNDCAPSPLLLWEIFQHQLALDFILRHDGVEDIGQQHALQEIANYLEEHGKSLEHYGLPLPTVYSAEVENELQRWGVDREAITARAQQNIHLLNDEQRHLFDLIVNAACNHLPFLLFIDGKAGRGKTFLVNAICDHLRALGHIVMPTATSGYAAQLYPRGRTTHSAFKASVCRSNSKHSLSFAIGARERRL